jgi:ABC-type nitrate/sulfonate/bicarbonate transport system permease component
VQARVRNAFADAIENVDWPDLTLSWATRALSLVVGVAIWQLACAYKLNFIVNFENIPSPLVVLSALIKHAYETKFYLHILVSIKRILIAFVLASAVGIIIGVAIGRLKIARDIVIPHIEILRPIPAVAWIPLAILMWPTEEASIIYITLLGALFPIVLNTVHGVEQTPEVLVRAAQSFGATRLQILRHVVVPAAMPAIAAGAGHRHGCVMVLAAGRRDHLRPVWHRLLYLERLFPHRLPRYRRRHAGDRPAWDTVDAGGAQDHAALSGVAKEIPMSIVALRQPHRQAGIVRAVMAGFVRRRGIIVAFAIGFPIVFYLLLLGVLVAEYGHLPNYVTRYDWIANVLRIIASTRSVADMVPIILDEWLLEVGYMDYDYGHGIADWSLSIVPHKLAIMSLAGALIGLNVALLLERQTARTLSQDCLRACRSGLLTSVGALFAGLTGATVFSVACCAAPSWAGSLAVLGVETSVTFALEPFGPIASLVGIAALVVSALWLVREGRTSPAPAVRQTPQTRSSC